MSVCPFALFPNALIIVTCSRKVKSGFYKKDPFAIRLDRGYNTLSAETVRENGIEKENDIGKKEN